MKNTVKKIKIVGLKSKSSVIDEVVFTDDRGGYFVDDSYGREGIELGKIVSVGIGTQDGVPNSRVLFLADKDNLAVGSGHATEGSIPYSVVYHVSVPDMFDPILTKDVYSLRPNRYEGEQLIELRYGVCYVQGFDVNGNKINAFEQEDIDKKLYLGKDGNISAVKPTTGYDKPIGRVNSPNTMIFDVENKYFSVKPADIVIH